MSSNWPENCQKLMLEGRIKYKYSSVMPSRFSNMTQVKSLLHKKRSRVGNCDKKCDLKASVCIHLLF